jgi:hypothetical protein
MSVLWARRTRFGVGAGSPENQDGTNPDSGVSEAADTIEGQFRAAETARGETIGEPSPLLRPIGGDIAVGVGETRTVGAPDRTILVHSRLSNSLVPIHDRRSSGPFQTGALLRKGKQPSMASSLSTSALH